MLYKRLVSTSILQLSDIAIDKDQHLPDRDTGDGLILPSEPPRHEFKDGWARYRFLLIPAFLGLLALIGVQTVICALWLPRRQSRNYRRLCCSSGCGPVRPCNPVTNCSELRQDIDVTSCRLHRHLHSDSTNRCREGIGSVPRYVTPRQTANSVSKPHLNNHAIISPNKRARYNESRQKPHQVVQFASCPTKDTAPEVNFSNKRQILQAEPKAFALRIHSNHATRSTESVLIPSTVDSLAAVLANIKHLQGSDSVINISV